MSGDLTAPKFKGALEGNATTATTADKTKSALKIQQNGADLITFDGSTPQTANITPTGIGAAPSSHTHSMENVVGLSDALNKKANDANVVHKIYTTTNTEINKTDPGTAIYNVENVNIGTEGNYNRILALGQHQQTSGGFSTQLAFPYDGGKLHAPYIRASDKTNWTEWKKLAFADHTHTSEQVTDLKGLLDGKAAAVHKHNLTTDVTGILPVANGGTGNATGNAPSAQRLFKNNDTFDISRTHYLGGTAMMFDATFKNIQQESGKDVRVIYGFMDKDHYPYVYDSISQRNDPIYTHHWKPTPTQIGAAPTDHNHDSAYLKLNGGGTVNGNVTATTFVGNLNGKATSADKLATPRNINGVPFDGTGDITINFGGENGGGYILPVATADALGGVKSKGDINVAEDGTVTVKDVVHKIYTTTKDQIEKFDPGTAIYNVENVDIKTGNGNYNRIICLGEHRQTPGGYSTEIAFPYFNGINNNPSIRVSTKDKWSDWKKILLEGDITLDNLGAAPKAHTHTQDQITNLSETLNGKAAAAHKHNASDINAGVLAVANGGTGNATGNAPSAKELISGNTKFTIDSQMFQNAIALCFRGTFDDPSKSGTETIQAIYGMMGNDHHPYFYDSISSRNDPIYTQHFKPTPAAIGAAAASHTHTPDQAGALPKIIYCGNDTSKIDQLHASTGFYNIENVAEAKQLPDNCKYYRVIVLGDHVQTPIGYSTEIAIGYDGGNQHAPYMRYSNNTKWSEWTPLINVIGASPSNHNHDTVYLKKSEKAASAGTADKLTNALTFSGAVNQTYNGSTAINIDIPPKYTHPTGNGNNHIPANGAAGQILKWSSAGTAIWADNNNTTNIDIKPITNLSYDNKITYMTKEVGTIKYSAIQILDYIFISFYAYFDKSSFNFELSGSWLILLHNVPQPAESNWDLFYGGVPIITPKASSTDQVLLDDHFSIKWIFNDLCLQPESREKVENSTLNIPRYSKIGASLMYKIKT